MNQSFIFILLFIFLSACSNSKSSLQRKSASGLDTGEIDGLVIDDPLFKITEIIPEDARPEIRILGDGSGGIAKICGIQSGVPSGHDTNCLCSFTSSDGSRSWNFPATYYESDLLTCPLNLIDYEFTLRIIDTTTSKRGLDHDVTVNAPSVLSFDPLNFDEVHRFQCRPKIFIPNPFCEARNNTSQYNRRCTLDPIQSESLHVTYPVNYFTTNQFLSVRSLQNSYSSPNFQNTFWDCEMNLNDTVNNKWINPPVYYKPPGASTNKLIFPPSTNPNEIDHQTFYLSRQRNSLFTQPILAGVHPLPSLPQANDEGDPRQMDVIGYAAPSFLRGGKHTCDTQISPPKDWEWVLVWVLINPNMPDRNYSRESNILDPIIRTHERNGGITCFTDYDQSIKISPGSSCRSLSGTGAGGLQRRFFHHIDDATLGGTVKDKPGSCFLVEADSSKTADKWNYVQGGSSFPFLNGSGSEQFPQADYDPVSKNMRIERHPFFYDDYLFLVTEIDNRTTTTSYHEIKVTTAKHFRLCNNGTNCTTINYNYTERQSGTRLNTDKVSPFCTMRPKK